MGTLVKTNGDGSLFPAIPSLFDDFFTRDLFNWNAGNFSNGNTLPAVNIRETGNSFEIEVAAPGMKKSDFKVELDNDQLVISAQQEKKNDEKDREGNYTRREFSYQTFRRSFSLPERLVENEKISAKYHDGILHITVPKTEEAKVRPPKQIQIA